MDRHEAQELLIRELPLLDRIVGAVCRRNRLEGADADDFASTLKLKLIENDYAVLRSFEGKSRFSTWLTIVVQRHLLDHRNSLWGKWRPSAEASRLGEAALLLERLLHRDGLTLPEAARVIRSSTIEISEEELTSLAAALPSRTPRPIMQPLDESPAAAMMAPADAEGRLLDEEREKAGEAAARVLTDSIERLDPEDRIMMRMRFRDGLSVAQISRALGRDQRQLYYRIERIAAGLRKELEAAGVDRRVARDLLESGASALEVRFAETAWSQPSNDSGTARAARPEVRPE